MAIAAVGVATTRFSVSWAFRRKAHGTQIVPWLPSLSRRLVIPAEAGIQAKTAAVAMANAFLAVGFSRKRIRVVATTRFSVAWAFWAEDPRHTNRAVVTIASYSYCITRLWNLP